MKSFILSFLFIFAVGIFNVNAYSSAQINKLKSNISQFEKAITFSTGKNTKAVVQLKSIDLSGANKLDSIIITDNGRKVIKYNERNQVVDFKYWLYSEELKEQQIVEYDASGNLTKHSVYYLDDNAGFVEVSREEYIFNGSGKLTSEINYGWDEDYSKLLPTDKNEYTYGSNKLTVYTFSWDQEIDNWVDGAYEVVTTDSKDRPISADVYSVNEETNQQELSTKLTWKYNNAGNITLISYSTYDEDLQGWLEIMRSESIYNGAGNITEEKEYFTVDVEMITWSQSIYSYDISGNLIRKVDSDLNFFTGEMAESAKTEWSYSGGKLQSETEFEVSYDGSGSFSESYKRIYSYSNNSAANIVNPEIVGEYYDVNDILSSEVYEYGLVSKVDHYSLDYETMDLALGRTATYYYSNETAQAGNDDATLSDLQIDEVSVDDFASDIYDYTVTLASNYNGTPVVDASGTDANATVSISQASQIPGTASIVVIAEDGVTQIIYYIHFEVESEPDATLNDLLVDGTSIQGFHSDDTNYTIYLSAEFTGLPVVTATLNDVNATSTINQVSELPGTAWVDVLAADGETTLTYWIYFDVAESNNANLTDILLDGNSIDGFNADQMEYRVELLASRTEAPEVTVNLSDENASVSIEQATSLPGSATIFVIAADGTTTKTYTIEFTKQTGIDDLKNKLKTYPNPFNNHVCIDLSNQRINQILITDINGKIIIEKQVGNESYTTIETSMLNDGAYIITVQSENNPDLHIKMMKE